MPPVCWAEVALRKHGDGGEAFGVISDGRCKSQPGLPNSIVAIFCPAVKSENTEMSVTVFAIEANMPEAYRD